MQPAPPVEEGGRESRAPGMLPTVANPGLRIMKPTPSVGREAMREILL